MSNFQQLNLPPQILKSITKKGYETPTPIQSQAIPALMEGSDLLGIAQTGTGKTAAFAWPILTRLNKDKQVTRSKNVRTLILTPTRELASQINTNFRTYSEGMGVFSGVIFGGVGKKGQITMMSKGCDILIATPGRLLDLMNDGFIKFDQLEVFVLDEADRMLDMGFIHDIKRIIAKLPKEKQTMLFSATMPKAITSLVNTLLKNPKRVEVTPESSTVEKIDQKIYMVDQVNKLRLLKDLLKNDEIKSALVFTRTKHGADRVVKELTKVNIKSAAIHGNKSQAARERSLKIFKEGTIRVLVATDIAARGIDIDRVTHVFNYNLPEDAESYVHRIGRTARAGREGVSISFCEATEVKFLKNVEKFIKYNIPVEEDHEYHVVHTKEEIEAEEKRKLEHKAKRLEMRKSSRPKTRNSQNARSGSIKTKAKAKAKSSSQGSAKSGTTRKKSSTKNNRTRTNRNRK
ncbi:DEAD/DEAH box helicase [Bacteriovoracaceae bacterium]|nr:DEAD/DEAH box helicase [Bacteriovoracaceae bacterium]